LLKRAFTQAQAKVLLAKLCSAALLDTLEFKRSNSGQLTLTGDTKLSAVWNQPLPHKSSREVKKLMKSVCMMRWLILGKNNTLDEFIKIVPMDILKKIHWYNFLLLNIHSLINTLKLSSRFISKVTDVKCYCNSIFQSPKIKPYKVHLPTRDLRTCVLGIILK
jgi:hypothetical protein